MGGPPRDRHVAWSGFLPPAGRELSRRERTPASVPLRHMHSGPPLAKSTCLWCP